MFNWFKELIEIKHQARERKLRLLSEHEENKHRCASCEVLKETVTRLHFENDRLFNELLKKNIESTSPVLGNPTYPPPKGFVPWNVKKHAMEAEDREKARIMKEAPKPISTEDLEKDMEIARSERESKTGL